MSAALSSRADRVGTGADTSRALLCGGVTSHTWSVSCHNPPLTDEETATEQTHVVQVTWPVSDKAGNGTELLRSLLFWGDPHNVPSGSPPPPNLDYFYELKGFLIVEVGEHHLGVFPCSRRPGDCLRWS